MTDPRPSPTYTRDEVAAILTRGLERQHDGARISHDELLETAREIGMSTLEIEAAVAEEVRQRAARLEVEAARERAFGRFLLHLSVFVVTSAMLAALDAHLGRGAWAHWVALGWGAGLAVHASRVLRR